MTASSAWKYWRAVDGLKSRLVDELQMTDSDYKAVLVNAQLVITMNAKHAKEVMQSCRECYQTVIPLL